MEFWSPDLVHHTRNDEHGYEATKLIIAQFMSNFEDGRFEIEAN